jgi:hypothetical protein
LATGEGDGELPFVGVASPDGVGVLATGEADGGLPADNVALLDGVGVLAAGEADGATDEADGEPSDDPKHETATGYPALVNPDLNAPGLKSPLSSYRQHSSEQDGSAETHRVIQSGIILGQEPEFIF